jgi:hypothetical protein
MASPPIPPPFDDLRNRPLSFYPPILNVEHNDWLFRKATWPEILVVNRKSGEEVWIPRRFLGEISRVDSPVLVIELNHALEYRAGAVWPSRRSVLQMPLAVGDSPNGPHPVRERRGAAPVVNIRLESAPERRILKAIGGAVAVSVTLYLTAVSVSRVSDFRQRNAIRVDRSFVDLTANDDWASVTAKLGPPVADRWHGAPGGVRYRALAYRHFIVILMSASETPPHYLGAVDSYWRPIHAAPSPNGASAELLRRIDPF